jgi:hypothetical protein
VLSPPTPLLLVACQAAAQLLSQRHASQAPTACAQPASHRVREQDSLSSEPITVSNASSTKSSSFMGVCCCQHSLHQPDCNCATRWSQVLARCCCCCCCCAPPPPPPPTHRDPACSPSLLLPHVSRCRCCSCCCYPTLFVGHTLGKRREVAYMYSL